LIVKSGCSTQINLQEERTSTEYREEFRAVHLKCIMAELNMQPAVSLQRPSGRITRFSLLICRNSIKNGC
jgi:hypothetical protein